ncbi:AP-3 complex subunit mu-1 isoform X1 [Gadus macrocephalus]|uniref:AP-3 complex subunit mu-1 isoform X1 n=2 Tax=Gadus macrocephalus TaxID=80720 RepID=UPI0028CB7124|nr:AP-3 complex subunit mu-1 isoform X1 [Gadus macrocephalus]
MYCSCCFSLPNSSGFSVATMNGQLKKCHIAITSFIDSCSSHNLDSLPIVAVEMIHSLFLINHSGDIFLEKHWKSVIGRSVCDYFFEAKEKAAEPEDVPPVLQTPHHYLISIYRDRLFFLSVIQTEAPPLFVIEFLHRVVETFQDYFGECSETVIKDNVVTVYELLEEMLDNGFPLATESNILKEMIRPPTILRTMVNTLTGTSNFEERLPSGQLSTIPWRRSGVKYTNNEAYFDVIEEIDAIVDKSGTTVCAEIQGVIEACVKLTGMPDLTLSFMNPRLLDDVSFHPCVRFKRWEAERVLSFIPPDGNFTLMSYHVNAQNLVAIPVYVKQNISFFESGSGGRLDLTAGPKQTMGKTVEGLVITIHMPKAVLSASLTATQGSYTYDPATKVLVWNIGRLNPQKLPNLRGSLSLQAGAPKPEDNPSINIALKIQQLAISGLKVNRLDMYGEKYKPFKGVKYVTKAGKFQVRT